ncbi:uncharacterized protein NPIL_382621 [Nephila pilipes]|uniref:Uncharacterized protein n=1 Tax=Nephila pilipes TaxID=299642 RepID=A0A8X6TUS5_NEPPI|nr:uncharacterized protein NPIL_382621 [Nephila pilipes]
MSPDIEALRYVMLRSPQLWHVRYISLSGSDNNGEHLLTRTERSFGGNKIEPPSRPNSYWDDPHYRPYFDNSTERNATAQLGKTAYLNCKIRQLGDRTVGATETSNSDAKQYEIKFVGIYAPENKK